MPGPACRTLVSVLVGGLTLMAISPMAMSTAAGPFPVCGPSSPRFEANFTTVEGKSGRVTRGFGTLDWSGGRFNYDIRSGHVIDVCLAEVDKKEGVELTVSGLRFRGPVQGSESLPGLNLVGFGSARAQVAPDLGATGTNASLGVAAVGATLTITGLALVLLRGRRYRRGNRSTPIGIGSS